VKSLHQELWMAGRGGTVLAALLLCGCAVLQMPGKPLPVPSASTRPPLVEHAYPRLAADLLAESNRTRGTAGLPALSGCAELDSAAEEYARELAARQVLDHSSAVAGRENVGLRVAAVRVNWTQVAENLFSYTGAASDQLARRTIMAWLNSPGHRENLLDRTYTHTGLGVARDVDGTWYVVQLYVQPAGTR
jgi:uncharacterized protein YkwD